MKVIFATGGSGGHLFPAVDVAERLKKQGHDVFFVGPIKVAQQMLASRGLLFEYLHVSGFVSKGLLGKVKAMWFSLMAFLKAMFILRRERPDVVCGFGSYASFAVVLAAKFLRIPTMIHEQNVVPGKANLTLAKHVHKIAISFKETEKYFSSKQCVLTGCPSHVPIKDLSKEQACKEFHIDPEKFVICILGGSQGSHFLNEIGVEVVEKIYKDLNVHVIHICGDKNFDHMQREYKKSQIPVALFRFLEKIEYAYQASDLIISRAGAVTMTEIGLFQKNAIIVPYPHALDHQRKNAEAIQEYVDVTIVSQSEVTVDMLKDLIVDKMKTQSNINNNLSFLNEPGNNLAKEIVSLAK